MGGRHIGPFLVQVQAQLFQFQIVPYQLLLFVVQLTQFVLGKKIFVSQKKNKTKDLCESDEPDMRRLLVALRWPCTGQSVAILWPIFGPSVGRRPGSSTDRVAPGCRRSAVDWTLSVCVVRQALTVLKKKNSRWNFGKYLFVDEKVRIIFMGWSFWVCCCTTYQLKWSYFTSQYILHARVCYANDWFCVCLCRVHKTCTLDDWLHCLI